MLEVLQYQFARYLLISSSRPGTLPANLQGIWNDTNWPPWSADFHLNINLQMNYWPAGAANLLETIEPLRDLTEFLRITGRLTAQQWSYEAGTPADQWRDVDAGWTAHLGTTIWGLSSPGPSWGWGWHPTGNAFLSQNLYQYLQYGGCPDIFIRDYWPAIRTATIMWKEALFMPDHGPWEGYYVALPSYSPEYGPLTVATAYDQQLIWELFTMTLSIMDQLGIDDVQFAENVKYFRDNLYSPVSIGSPLNELPLPPGIAAEFPETGGIHPPVVQEWPGTPGVRLPTVGSQRSHRHMSHMVGLYPGTSVNMNDPIHAEAAINSLIMRGLGATGWSQGWKLNLWARSNDVERTYQMVNQMFALNIAPNLFGLHDVRFQIDANMGYAAGIHEMLLQSHLGTLDLLPTFPGDVWVNGHIRGIRSIGGHSIDMYWAQGVLESAHITPHTTGDIGIRYSLFTDDDITVTLDGDPVIINEDGVLIVDAVAGRTFVIRLKSANDLEPEPVVFSGNNPNVLRALLEDNDVILKTAGNLGIFAHHRPFAIPAGRTLTVATTLNVQANAELIINGTLIVQEGGRVNNQGAAGGTIRIANGGRIVNNGHVENVTNSTVINYGTIENNARFEVRANTTFCSCDGVVIGSVSINTHRNAITC
jgi:alpha-L-fucosidase 2